MSQSRKALLQLNKKELIKRCKKHNVPITGSKKQMVDHIVDKLQKAKEKEEKNRKTIQKKLPLGVSDDFVELTERKLELLMSGYLRRYNPGIHQSKNALLHLKDVIINYAKSMTQKYLQILIQNEPYVFNKKKYLNLKQDILIFKKTTKTSKYYFDCYCECPKCGDLKNKLRFINGGENKSKYKNIENILVQFRWKQYQCVQCHIYIIANFQQKIVQNIWNKDMKHTIYLSPLGDRSDRFAISQSRWDSRQIKRKERENNEYWLNSRAYFNGYGRDQLDNHPKEKLAKNDKKCPDCHATMTQLENRQSHRRLTIKLIRDICQHCDLVLTETYKRFYSV
eukprot:339546_1